MQTAAQGAVVFYWEISGGFRFPPLGLSEQIFEQRWVIAGPMGDVIHQHLVPHEPIDAEIFSCNGIAIAIPAQFRVPWERTRQWELLQPSQCFQDAVRDPACRVWPHQLHVQLCNGLQVSLCRLQNHKFSHLDRSPPTACVLPPAYR